MAVRDHQFAYRLLSCIRSGLVAIDADGRLAALNSEAQRILGCPRGAPEDALGLPCRTAFEAQPAIAELLLDALDGNDRPIRTELLLQSRGDVEARTIGFTATVMAACDGSVEGAAMLFRDLTPYERAEEQDRLRERLEALGQMAAGLAHEMRSPLASMEILVGLLKRHLGEHPEELVLVSELAGELHTLADTVTASLDFVRPLEPVRNPVDAVELLEESLALARSRVPFAGAIERDYVEEVPTLLADGEQLRTVTTNLLVNALEAMRDVERSDRHVLRLGLRLAPGAGPMRAVRVPGGELRARARDAPPALVISVSDTGGGVPSELRERIFYPFFTTKQRGSGIGLANAQKIVASHGGSIEIESVAGAGSRFFVVLPLEAPEPPCR